jgi:HSP20 family protein
MIPRENPIEMFRRECAPLFERAFPVLPMPFEALWDPPWGLETEERENEFVVRAELPGFEASELEVTIAANTLIIRAMHGKEAEGTETRYVRPFARLERSVTLPEGLNLERVEAVHRNGVLEVHFPRTPEAEPRRIEVRTGGRPEAAELTRGVNLP